MPRRPATIDDYLATLRPEPRAALQHLRTLVHQCVPDAEECLHYGMPAFRRGRVFLGLGASPRHCSLFLMSSRTLCAFVADLAHHDVGAGTIRFQPDAPLPATLVRRLVRARLAEQAAATAARPTTTRPPRGAKTFRAACEAAGRGGIRVAVPFDADRAWGKKPTHHVGGRIGAYDVRGPLARADRGFVLQAGPAWHRDHPVRVGERVRVTLWPEGPQRDDLAADFAAALARDARAGAFFDGLAQFYRRGYLRWIDATKRSPLERARRIAQTIQLLRAGKKARPAR